MNWGPTMRYLYVLTIALAPLGCGGGSGGPRVGGAVGCFKDTDCPVHQGCYHGECFAGQDTCVDSNVAAQEATCTKVCASMGQGCVEACGEYSGGGVLSSQEMCPLAGGGNTIHCDDKFTRVAAVDCCCAVVPAPPDMATSSLPDRFTIPDFSPCTPVDQNLTHLVFLPTSVDFGGVVVDTTSTETYVGLKNESSNQTLEIGISVWQHPDVFFLDTQGTLFTLKPGEETHFGVLARPNAIGLLSDVILLEGLCSNTAGAPIPIAVTGQ
jgi:hypothetical protein